MDYVRYVGEPVALVLAQNRYIAEDAIENIKVSYDKYEPVIDTVKATFVDAPKVHVQLDNNIVSDRKFSYGNPEKAFENAEKIIDLKF